jgi:hypothetical protein
MIIFSDIIFISIFYLYISSVHLYYTMIEKDVKRKTTSVSFIFAHMRRANYEGKEHEKTDHFWNPFVSWHLHIPHYQNARKCLCEMLKYGFAKTHIDESPTSC